MANGSNLNGKILNPLIDFDIIVNTDIGLLRFIRSHYQDPKAFDLDILNRSDRELLSLLYIRENWNPLSVISTKENLPDIDALYISFFDNFKKEIVAISSVELSTFRFLKSLNDNGTNFGVNTYIAVRDEFEATEIRNRFNKLSIIYKKDTSFLSDKDVYYVKDYRFFTENNITNTKGKKVYLLPMDYSLNFFSKEEYPFTLGNIIYLFGTDYRKGDEEINGSE